MDSQVLIDGGWLLSMGQEESLADLVAIYRRLPAVRLAAVGDNRGDAATQPVTFRSASYQGRTYVYAVNDAPFPVTAAVHLEAAVGCRLQDLAGPRRSGTLRQEADGLQWQVELGPYDVAAAILSDSAANFSRPQVSIPPAAARPWHCTSATWAPGRPRSARRCCRCGCWTTRASNDRPPPPIRCPAGPSPAGPA